MAAPLHKDCRCQITRDVYKAPEQHERDCPVRLVGVGRVVPAVGRPGFTLPQDGHVALLQRENARLRELARGLVDEIRSWQDYEPLEESQHYSDCPLAEGYWNEEEGTSALTEEIVLEKCECSMGAMLRAMVKARTLEAALGEREGA